MKINYNLTKEYSNSNMEASYTVIYSIEHNNYIEEFKKNLSTREDALAFIILLIEASNECSTSSLEDILTLFAKINTVNVPNPIRCEEVEEYYDYQYDEYVCQDVNFVANLERLIKGGK